MRSEQQKNGSLREANITWHFLAFYLSCEHPIYLSGPCLNLKLLSWPLLGHGIAYNDHQIHLS